MPPTRASASAPQHPLRFRDRPEIHQSADERRASVDIGSIDTEHASAADGLEFGGNWKNFYRKASTSGFDVERPATAALLDPDFKGYYVQSQLDRDRRASPL